MISSANKNQKNYKCIWPIYSRATKVYFSCWASCSYECSMQNGWTKVTAVLCFPLCDSCQCRCTAWRGRWDWELYSLCSRREWTGRYIIIRRITRGCLATAKSLWLTFCCRLCTESSRVQMTAEGRDKVDNSTNHSECTSTMTAPWMSEHKADNLLCTCILCYYALHSPDSAPLSETDYRYGNLVTYEAIQFTC